MEQVNTLQEDAIIQINRLIIEGQLKMGQRINEVDLSQMLNMSRGPIRESLRILNEQGLLTYLPRKGMYVTELFKEDIKEIFDVRLSLEKTAVELGFNQVNDDTIQTLKKTVDLIEKYSSINRKDILVELDAEFHLTIISLPGYKRLINLWKPFNSLLSLAFSKIFEYGTESSEDLVNTHRHLIRVLEQNNKTLFLKALSEHYENGKTKLLEIWK